MSSKKIDLYTSIHKAQRGHLFDLSCRIGKADFTNQQEVNAIKQDLEAIIAHLRGHSHNEATFIHPLYVEAGNKASFIDDDHEDLEEELHKLEGIVKDKKWDKLYAEFNRFLAHYLSHQDEEERSQEEILWKHFDNSRLSAALDAFFASRSPAVAMEDLKFVVPHLSMLELNHMYNGMKLSAPEPAFKAACHIAEALLEPHRWLQLHQAITH